MNELIETIFADFKVDNKVIPISYMRYNGKEETYITYQHLDIDNTLAAEDEIIGYIDYYDFDIYTKSNYFNIVKELKKILKENGFIWQPSKTSIDMFEDDTRFFHKTLCFAIERME